MENSIDKRLLCGAYPRLYDKCIEPSVYYPNYINTYIERDVRNIKDITDLGKFNRFLKLCAARTAQLLNKSSLANDCGISVPTVGAWLSLLEIKTETQMNTHYLRGNLFENMVISDFIKNDYNRGILNPAVTFWRDSIGNEVDLIYRNGDEEFGYEIKSAQTFNDSFLDGLKYWSKYSGADALHRFVIYGGDTPMKRSEAEVIPFSVMRRLSLR